MTAQISVAANLIPNTLIYGHLQIVYEDAAGNLVESETTSPGFPYFFGDWVFRDFGRPHDDESNTPGYGDAQDYAIVPLDLGPQQTAMHVWELLGQIHASLSGGGHGLNYDINQNSNSYVTSVLSVVGIDIDDYLSELEPDSVSGFPGVGTNIFEGARTGGLFSGYDTEIPLTLAGTEGHDYIAAGIGDDALGGAAGNDEIHAGRGSDTVLGGSGNDTLLGGAHDDLIYGGSQYDEIHGEAGDDALHGGNGRDTVHGGDGDDVLHDNGQTGVHAADLFLGGIGEDTIFGGGGNDSALGQDGDDLIYGGAQYDEIRGEAGNDTLHGGNGRDTVHGGDGNDVLHDNGQSGVHGDDEFFGDAGDDTIHIGGSDDSATGGSGADTFLFFGGNIGADVVTDYQTGTDALTLDEALWGGGLDAAGVVGQFASVVGGDMVVFEFGGGNSITLLGIGSTAGLAEDIAFL